MNDREPTDSVSPVRTIPAEENRWGVPVFDIRQRTLRGVSTSQNPNCAANLISLQRDDGASFIGAEAASGSVAEVGLKYPIDRILAEGVLFRPLQMEHKWAVFYREGRIIFVRSWQRRVLAIADTTIGEGSIEVTRLYGGFISSTEPTWLSVRILNYILRSHALGETYPAPILAEMEENPEDVAVFCFSQFGNLAHYATSHEMPRTQPKKPLRTHSLLHLAVEKGDMAAVQSTLRAGFPADLLGADGLAPLHWAADGSGIPIAALLLEHGSSVDVRSAQGATPLKQAVQARNPGVAAFLLRHGADPNAKDDRGFTALHSAAELNEPDLAQELLDAGASPDVEAEGLTPKSLAKMRQAEAVLRLLP